MNQARKSRRANELKASKTQMANPPQTQNDQNSSVTKKAVFASFSGPIPPPQAMAFYEQVCPGAAHRILKMAEEQHTHRIAVESLVFPEALQTTKRGQIFAFIVAIMTLCSIVFLGYIGMSLVAFSLSLALGYGVVKTFITGQDDREPEKKIGEVLKTRQAIEDASDENKKAGG
ncbi:MAG: DUF2335 domain-containing protein [Candidatus Riflebacteria bacterium]|nr:DUF2335 domain-containing protein [Candidatus Riflebacteria bacterium]